MIIVTGMDNTGKTTLVRQLQEALGLRVIKSIGPTTRGGQIGWFMKQYQEDLFTETIYDRFVLLEEVVYGNTLRGESNFGLSDAYYKALEDVNPLIIYTRPSKEIIFNFGGREQMEGVIEWKERLLLAYDELIGKMTCDKFEWDIHLYNYTDPEALEKVINKCKKHITKRESVNYGKEI